MLHAHFHFSLGWAVTRVYQTPPFPNCDPLCLTSSIRTMGRDPSPKNKNVKTACGWRTGCSGDRTPFFPPRLAGHRSVAQRAQMQSRAHTCNPDTQRSNTTLAFTVSQDVSLTPHHFQAIVHAHVQIGRLMSGMSASGHAQKPPWLR